MTWRPVLLVIVVITFSVVGPASSVVLRRMVDELNQSLPRENAVSPLWWYPGKLFSVVDMYRRNCPHGRRHLQLRRLMIIGFVAGAVGAAALLLPR